MRRLKLATVLVSAFAALTAQAQELILPARFHGTGRACYGDLLIQPRAISWNTPFSQCRAVPYELLERGHEADKTRYIYRLHQTTRACHYHLLALTHLDGKNADIGWEVTGYGSEQNYQADKNNIPAADTPDALSCYLVRDPQR